MNHVKRFLIGLGALGLSAFFVYLPGALFALLGIATCYGIGWFFHSMWSDFHHDCDADPECDDDFCSL